MSHNFEEQYFMVAQPSYLTGAELKALTQAFNSMIEQEMLNNLQPSTVSTIGPPVVVCYPNVTGEAGRYTLRDQRDYFSKFPGGACQLFGAALTNVVSGDLLNYTNCCNETFDNYCQVLFDENTLTMDRYAGERREYNRRIFDIYRFAKTSVSVLGDELPYNTVKQLAYNETFDSGAFLLK